MTELFKATSDNNEGLWVSLRPYLLLAGAAFLFNLGPSLANFYDWNYDSWAHLFFSSHYMNSWFDTWNPQWFGGFSVTSYPPLVAQLMALLAFPFGLAHAYSLLSFGSMVLLPIAVFSFCCNFLPRQQATWAGFLSIILPSIYLTNYAYGQLNALFALMTILFLGAALWRYLERGGIGYTLMAALLAGVTAASHHFTFICFAPVMVVTISFSLLALHRVTVKTLLKRLGIFGALGLPLVLLPIFPLWKFTLESEMQTPILHLSRVNLFTDNQAFWQFFMAPYLLFLVALPLSVWAAYRNRYLIPLCAMAFFLFVLGLGGTTPLPHLIFGHWWQWLTYERFSLWAGVLFLPLLAVLMPLSWRNKGKRAIRWVVSVVIVMAVLVMATGSAYLASEPLRRSFLPSPPEVDHAVLIEFLNGPEVGQKYRYITLGFGEAQMQKLSTLTNARSLDGSYYTARQLPVLRESGIGAIDACRYRDPELKTLGEILATASSYNLKWILVNDTYYYDILGKNGFELRFSFESSGDMRLRNVTIWEKTDIPLIETEDKSERGVWSYVWGIAPILLLAALIAAFLTVRIKQRSLVKRRRPKQKAGLK